MAFKRFKRNLDLKQYYHGHLHHHNITTTAISATPDDNVNDPIQSLLNDTGSELSGLSHVDAPNDSLYMIGGVLIAMLLVGVIIVLLAITISKLRKREEHSNSVHPAEVVLQTTTISGNNGTTQTTIQTVPTNTNVAALTLTQPQPLPPEQALAYRGQFLWQYPPPPPQYTLYSNDQDTLVQNITNERPGFVRGFRKNLGGRWRRLVKRKPETEVYTIPAELKPQLKQIYVY